MLSATAGDRSRPRSPMLLQPDSASMASKAVDRLLKR
jgi:hypothetical protein